MIDHMKSITFDKVDDIKWQEEAIKSLRGLPFERLKKETMEGIITNPLYTKEGYDTYFKGKNKDLIRTIQSGKGSPGWVIAQQTYSRDGDEFLQELEDGLEKGNEAIVYHGDNPVNFSKDHLEALAQLITIYPIYAFNIQQDDPLLRVLTLIAPHKRELVHGVVTGGHELPEGYTHVRTYCADVTDIHMQGADAVTELALTLAIIVHHSENVSTFNELAEKLSVRFAIDTNFFMEIAKLRAFRVLWKTLAQAYQSHAPRIPIIAETSLRTFTRFDSHTNMLRVGNETLAAVLGGVDVFTVHPHNIVDGLTPTGIRSARNIQLIVREESFINQVLDPAGGSYYIDTLTNELVNASWALFQEIESVGGYNAYQITGKLDEKINNVYKQRITRLSKGKDTLVGTTKYADIKDDIPTDERLGVNRVAHPFEHIRLRGLTSSIPTVLIRFGKLKEYKARADFSKGYLAVGGIHIVESPVFNDVKALQEWLNEHTFTYYILCTSLEKAVVLLKDVQALRHKWVDIAGRYTEEEMNELTSLGVAGNIYKDQDQLRKLKDIMDQADGREQH